MSEKGLDTKGYRAHRLALERWRDAYAAYIDSEPEYSEQLYQEVLGLTPQAHRALDAAHYHVAAPNDRGEMVYGLSSALPLIVERERILDRMRPADSHVEIHMIADDSEGASQSKLETLLQTVEYAIDALGECEAEGDG